METNTNFWAQPIDPTTVHAEFEKACAVHHGLQPTIVTFDDEYFLFDCVTAEARAALAKARERVAAAAEEKKRYPSSGLNGVRNRMLRERAQNPDDTAIVPSITELGFDYQNLRRGIDEALTQECGRELCEALLPCMRKYRDELAEVVLISIQSEREHCDQYKIPFAGPPWLTKCMMRNLHEIENAIRATVEFLRKIEAAERGSGSWPTMFIPRLPSAFEISPPAGTDGGE